VKAEKRWQWFFIGDGFFAVVWCLWYHCMHMARHKVADEIEQLRKQREQIDARLKAAEARQKEKEQQEEERRKTLAGTVALRFMAANPDNELTRVLSDLLDKYITRPSDRALFSALSRSAGWPDGTPDNPVKTDKPQPA
jgi:hypothetical protein